MKEKDGPEQGVVAPASDYKIITDGNGRCYRVGESAEQILGHPRSWMMWLPWVAMLAVSVFEYGYGAASHVLQQHNHWTMSQTFWIVTVWAMLQPAVAFPAGRLRESGALPVRTAMLTGAVLTGVGFFSLANTANIAVVFTGYAVLGGIGAGLVYASAINIVGKWFPDRRGARTGFVNGGFAYGAVPFIFIFSEFFHPSNYSLVLNLIGLFVMVVLLVCGLFFKDPPRNWWPAEIDPLEWVKNARSARRKTQAKNPPAVAQFTPLQALRTGQLPLMWMAFWMVGNVSLFGSAYQVPFAKSLGFGPLVAASSAGLLAVVNGVGRGFVGWISDHLGRKRTLTLVLLIEAVAQVGLLYTGKAHLQFPFLAMAFVAGFGGGAFFPLFAALVPDYFGENYNASNYGVVYSAKVASSLVGIGVGASVIHAMGWTAAYLIGAGLALASVGLTLLLRQPQEPPLPDIAVEDETGPAGIAVQTA